MTRVLLATFAIGFIHCGGSGSTAPDKSPRPAEVIPEAPAAAECADVPVLDFEQLAAGERAGQLVAVDGVPQVSVVCTLMDCGSAECCNSCGGSYYLMPDDRRQVNLLDAGGCSGMDCDMRCEPFGSAPTKAYRFVGRHEYRVYGDGTQSASDIVVERYCSTDGG